jgi:hypothetical protein
VPAFAGIAAAELAVLVTFVVCWGILYAYRNTIGAALGSLVGLLVGVHIHVPHVIDVHPLAFLGHALDSINKYVMQSLGAAVAWSQSASALLYYDLAKLVDLMVAEVEHLGADALGAFRRVEVAGGAALKRWVLKQIKKLAHAAAVAVAAGIWKAVKAALKTLHRVEKKAIAIERDLVHFRGYTRKQINALLRRLAKLGWIAGVAGVAALGHLIFKKLGLRWLLKHKTAAALVAAGLATLGLSWARCDRVGKAGRGLCGLDTDMLDLLLLDTLAIVGAVSLVEFTRDVQAITDPAVGIMRGFIREF